MATAAVLAVFSALSLNESRKSRRDSRRARRVAEKRSKLSNTKASIESVRKAQILSSQIIQQGANSGTESSSAVDGGVGSLRSQSAGNINFYQQLFNLQQSQRRLIDSAAQHTGNSQGFASLASLTATSAPFKSTRTDGGAPVTDLSFKAGS